jgi:peptidyl-prolyl cis-trans isomerase C
LFEEPPMPSSVLLRASLLALCLAAPGLATAQTPPAAPAQQAAPGSKPVARVDGTAITEADVALAAEDPALSLPSMSESQKRDLLVGYMVDLKIGARAAEAAKVGESPEFTRKLGYFRDKLLLDEYLDQAVKKAVTPEAARKLYDDTVKDMKPEQEVRARHILVEGEDEAKKVYARVKGGEDFAKVAGEVSKDPGSKTDGGDLGFFTKDRMVAPFAEAAFKMEPNQISEPVKTQFGWHVIQVEDKRAKQPPAFDQVKDQARQAVIRDKYIALVKSLRAEAKVEIPDEKLKKTVDALENTK